MLAAMRRAVALCGVDVTIDYLKVWEAPKIEQLRPRDVLVFLPYSKQANAMVDFGGFP
jgi:hypothetical protein